MRSEIKMKFIFFSKKKAVIDIAPSTLLGIVLGIVIVFGLLYLGAKLAGIFINKQELDATLNNFNVLVKHTNNLLKDKDFSSRRFTYSLANNFILVGFSYSDNNEIMRTKCTNENMKQSKPLLCEGFSCLCIYQNTLSNDFDSDGENKPLQCNRFDEKIVFLAPLNFNINDGFGGDRNAWQPSFYSNQNGYGYLVVYGNGCNTFGDNFGIKEIYLEKFKQGENIFIYMVPYSNDTNSEVQKRIKYVQENYRTSK